MTVPYKSDFGQASEEAERSNDLQQNKESFGDNQEKI